MVAMETSVFTVMFTDMKGFTSLTSGLSRKETDYLLSAQTSIITSLAKHHKGRVVKNLGDGHMILFGSPTNAVLCGLRIQDAIAKHNARAKVATIELRIAINSGEMTAKHGDVFGEPVNIASRILGVTKPGEVYFAESVYLSMNKKEIIAEKAGEHELKGVPEKIQLYRALREPVEHRGVGLLRLRPVHAVVEFFRKKPLRHYAGAARGALGAHARLALFAGVMLFLVAGQVVTLDGSRLLLGKRDNVKGVQSDEIAPLFPSITPEPSDESVVPTVTPMPTGIERPTPTLTATPTPTPRESLFFGRGRKWKRNDDD